MQARNDDAPGGRRYPRVDAGQRAAHRPTLRLRTDDNTHTQTVANTDPIKVGVLFSRTGVTSRVELSQLLGTFFAIREINDAGGINGRELLPVHRDPQCVPQNYRHLAERMVQEDKVLFDPSATTVQTFKGFGFEWGGDWAGKKVDRPHFQRVPPGQ